MAASTFLTVAKQAAGMRAAYPLLRPTLEAHWGGVWQGPLVGFDRAYTVRVAYWRGLVMGGCDLVNHGPEVHVLHPDLMAECGDEPLPHTYASPWHPKLCLFDPDSDDWDPGMLLADTIVPWAAEWFAFYEMWRVTGRWTGAERHPGPQALPGDQGGDGAASAPSAPTARQARAAGGWLGTEASRPLLGAAATGNLPSLARDWWRAHSDDGRALQAVVGGLRG